MQQSQTFTADYWPIGRVRPYPGNPRVITEEAISSVAASIKEFGWQQPIVVDEAGVILVGHRRRLAAIRLGHAEVPVHVAAGLTPAQARAYRLADNKLGEEGVWDLDALQIEIAALREDGFSDLGAMGFDIAPLDAGDAREERPKASLNERFGIPPFTVLNAREGWWQDRKRAWLALGIRSEIGRGDNALGFSETVLGATTPAGRRHG